LFRILATVKSLQSCKSSLTPASRKINSEHLDGGTELDPRLAAGAVGSIEDGMNATLILGLALIAEGAPLSVSELLTNADRFNAQPVTVSGSMSRFREHFTSSGTRYYTFDFGDSAQTVLVISYEKPQCEAGAATVEGIFDQVKWRARVSYSYEQIRARNVICFRGHEPKTK